MPHFHTYTTDNMTARGATCASFQADTTVGNVSFFVVQKLKANAGCKLRTERKWNEMGKEGAD